MATCPVCGGPTADEASGPAEVELIDGTAAPDGVEVAATLGRRGAPRLWLGLAAVVCLLVGSAWAIGRAGSSGPGPAAAASSSVPDASSASTDGSSAADGGTAPSPVPAVATTILVTGSDRGGYDSTSTSTPAGGSAVSRAGTGPVLGRPVGWSVIYGTSFGPDEAVRRLDLDTGVDVSFGQLQGSPVLVVDDRLVLSSTTEAGAAAVRIVPARDPQAPGVVGPDMAAPFLLGPDTVAPGPAGTAWIYGPAADGYVWQQVRLSDGKVLDLVPAGAPTSGGPVSGGGPDVQTSGSGGVYRRTGHQYVLVAEGRPLIVSGDAVLVRRCSSPTACRLRWVATADGRPVDRALLPEDGTLWRALPGTSRFVLGYRVPGTGGDIEHPFVIYDLERGQAIPTGMRMPGGAASSPDGRVLVVSEEAGFRFYDVEQGRWYQVSEGGNRGNGEFSFAFVPNR